MDSELDSMSCSEDQASCSNSLLDSSMLECESTRSVRKRVPTARYLEEDSYQVVKKMYAELSSPGKKRGRKIAEEKERIAGMKSGSSAESKWGAYKKKISYLARSVARDQHFVDSYEFDESDFAAKRAKHTPEDELRKANARIVSAKKAILEQFAALDAEHASHKRWLQLKKGFDAEDTFDVDDIMCSLCGGPDEEDNDVLFCDRANCLRAYHQMCLDPPLVSLDDISDNDDWFCRQCACMDECLDLVGEVLGHDCDDYTELFPELRPQTSNGAGSVIVDDSSESDDADYDPSEPDSEREQEASVGEGDNDGEAMESGSQSGNETTKIKYWKHSSADSASDLAPQRHKQRTETAGSQEDSHGSQEEGDGSGSCQDSDDGDSDDDDEREDGYGSDVSSGVSEDELQGLLADAQEGGLALDAGLQGDDAGQVAPRRNLRSRRATTADPLDKSRTPEGAADVGKAVAIVRRGVLTKGIITAFRFRTNTVNSPGRVKKGKHSVGAAVIPTVPVMSLVLSVPPSTAHTTADSNSASETAADASNYFSDSQMYFGTAVLPAPIVIHPLLSTHEPCQNGAGGDVEGNTGSDAAPMILATPPSLEEGVWTAKFDDDFVTFFGLETLRTYFNLYAEYASKLVSDAESANRSSSSSRQMLTVLEEQGKLDSANVLTHRRAHKPLDYAALSLQMFGDVPDEDEESSGDEVQSVCFASQSNDNHGGDGGLGSAHRSHSSSDRAGRSSAGDGGSSSRKRGRPQKVTNVVRVSMPSYGGLDSSSPRDDMHRGVSTAHDTVGKKRGRPRKFTSSNNTCLQTGSTADVCSPPKKRRPRKAGALNKEDVDSGDPGNTEEEQQEQGSSGEGGGGGTAAKKRGGSNKFVSLTSIHVDTGAPRTAGEHQQEPRIRGDGDDVGGLGVVGKKRGRPRRVALPGPAAASAPHSEATATPAIPSQLMNRAGTMVIDGDQGQRPHDDAQDAASESAEKELHKVHAPIVGSATTTCVDALDTSTNQQTVSGVLDCSSSADEVVVQSEVRTIVGTIISGIEIEESII